MNGHSGLMIQGFSLFKEAGSRILLLALLLAACYRNDGSEEELPQPETGVSYQVLTVFAPGQLGDRGYADNVLNGVNNLVYPIDIMGKNALDSRFVTPYNIQDAINSVSEWAKTPANPFKDGYYDRRLLVLTEPFMVGLLDYVKNDLRPTDEVLLLKVNEDDVNDAAKRYGMGNRIHGLNVSAAPSVRKFCAQLRLWIEEMEVMSGIPVYMNVLPIYRLYSDKEVNYRDSVYEVLSQELADLTYVVTEPVSDEVDLGLVSLTGTPVIEMAYELANMFGRSADFVAIVDLGAGNAGWDYWLLGNSDFDHFITLMLDAQESGYYRYNIMRRFDLALYDWVGDWLLDSVGAAPVQTTLCDEWYCDDNLDTDDAYDDDCYEEED